MSEIMIQPTPSKRTKSRFLRSGAYLAACGSFAALSVAAPASAQIGLEQTAAGTNRTLQLAEDSPFRDPDVIYLEADELINDDQNQMLTAIGEVEGRYQDRTLRAERVDYDLETGQVLASGNVVLIDATGDVQYADKLELSDELQAGTAANFTARLATGGTTAARFVTRSEDGEVELINATYTACEICKNSEGKTKTPTWRLRARRVKQDDDSRTIRYRDAVLELFGIPVLYTPYLAHPDPTQSRASGLLIPTVEGSGSRGFSAVVPYYWAINDYSELTLTPRVYSKVNPLLDFEGRRRFHTGEINVAGSFTYQTLFDRNGENLDDSTRFAIPSQAEKGPEFSSHLFLDGYFRPSGTWSYGYTVMLQTDDTYLERYGLDWNFDTNGLIPNERRRNTTQAFLAGQGDNFRVSALVAGFQDNRTTFLEDERTGLITRRDDDDDVLPIIAPRVKAEYYLDDPILDGRVKLFADTAYLTRETGQDYGRMTGGAEWSKTWIAPGGIEVKPFAWGRADRYELESEAGVKNDFSRGIGQAGVDLRYPFIRRGDHVDFIIEPRAVFTESFGSPNLDEFFRDPVFGALLVEDGISPELDPALLFEPNKADGFDYFQTGRRADVGARVAAQFQVDGQDSEVSLFAGRSFADNLQAGFPPGTGLNGDNSDYVGEFDLKLGQYLRSNTWLRVNDDFDKITQVQTTLNFDTKYVSVSGRYFNFDTPQLFTTNVLGAPLEEISGRIEVRPFGGWSLGYTAVHDFDSDSTRTQQATLAYRDDCTVFEIFFQSRDFDNDVIRNENSVGVRLTLATLGGLGSN